MIGVVARPEVHVSWLDPLREMTVVGSRNMVVYDDVADDKTGDVLLPHIRLPHIRFVEPLRLEAQHFVECIRA